MCENTSKIYVGDKNSGGKGGGGNSLKCNTDITVTFITLCQELYHF